MSTPSVGKAADDGADDDAADNASFAGADTESRLHPRLLSPYYFRARRDLNRLLTITIVVLGLCAIVLYFHFTHTLDYSSLFKHFALPFVVLILIILTVFWLIQISSRVTEVRFDFAANQIRESVVEQSKELQQSRPEYRDIELDRYHHGEDGSSVNFTYGDIAASSSIDRQEAILLEMYTQGLTSKVELQNQYHFYRRGIQSPTVRNLSGNHQRSRDGQDLCKCGGTLRGRGN
jgi:hypothetical protein